jgi:CBS domain-containing protein
VKVTSVLTANPTPPCSTETVRSLLKRKGSEIWSLPPDATVFDAIAMMAEKHVGALLVMSGGRLQGIISERDYARKVFLQGRSSKDTLVREIMTADVVTVRLDDTVDECMRVMTKHRVRHLPVVDGDKVAGVISIGDMVACIISAQADTITQLNAYISGQYPA